MAIIASECPDARETSAAIQDAIAALAEETGELIIRRALPEERSAALASLYSHVGVRRREVLFRWAAAHAQKSPNAFRHLLVAKRAGTIRGAIWGLLGPGRQANVLAPVVAEDESPTTRYHLMAALDRRLQEDPYTRVAIAVVGDASDSWKPMAAHDYHYITDIVRMEHCLGDATMSEPTSPLEFEPFRYNDPLRLKTILRRANADSLDCPRMDGMREVDDVFASHFDRQGYKPTLWRIVRCGGRDVGCVLVSHHESRNECEVIYLGLIGPARGNGWGKTLIRHAIWLAKSAEATRLTLGCDIHNPPALKTYEGAGFQAGDRSALFAKAYRPSQIALSKSGIGFRAPWISSPP